MSFVDRGDKSISLEKLILEAGHELARVVQWSRHLDWTDRKYEHIIAAKKLIELAEVMVCGSIGGFDSVEHNGKTILQSYNGGGGWREAAKYDTVFARWLWLFTFYVDGNDNTNVDGAAVKDLKKAFRLSED